jgi:hypothetical protein
MIKRLERLDIATSDLADAAGIYERNFGFSVRRTAGSNDASIAIGECEIRLRSGAYVAGLIAAQGEGLAAICLEAEDVDAVAAALDAAKLTHKPIRREGDRRVLEVDPHAASMVPLSIFDRRAN